MAKIQQFMNLHRQILSILQLPGIRLGIFHRILYETLKDNPELCNTLSQTIKKKYNL